ncbi:aspartate/glutamate racemase family protein [Agrococcus carbonis]|uniref:Aspartate racemase n=1 Tax=Agrococcus carbonis TaxID=684552 RepID=A0A1H1KTD8_9MICO|nr:amino acid racemase [Agrococcus carbonis]SDR65574.1 aspartate racemase [Agrococcus carbonis]
MQRIADSRPDPARDERPGPLGILGGMSWHSTLEYYRAVNERVARARGGHASARILLSSLDFAEVRDCQVRGDWDAAGALLAREASALERAGAGSIAIATNLMHKVAPAVEARIGVPLVHIGDAVAAAARAAGARTLGIVGTRWVMAERFYADRLAAHGIAAVVPPEAVQAELDRIVFDELTQGVMTDASRAVFRDAFAALVADGAEAIVLGCTEIMLLVRAEDAAVPLIDSCDAHADALARIALGEAAPHALAPAAPTPAAPAPAAASAGLLAP